MSKTYSNKSNATRAARKAGLDVATLAFVQVSEGAWTWAPVVGTYASGDQLVSFSDVDTQPARPYRLHKRNKAAEAKRAAALEAAAKAKAEAEALASKPKAAPAGETPRHKDFSVYGRSALLSPVQYVHQFLTANKGKGLTRKQALYELAQAGVNVHTARTQYQRWFALNK
jgi:hypothetical protein